MAIKKTTEPTENEFAVITADQLKKRYAFLQTDDINFIMNSEKMLISTGIIGSIKYTQLIEKRKSYDQYNEKYPNAERLVLSEREKNEILIYETDNRGRNLETIEAESAYTSQVRSDYAKRIDTVPGVPLTKETLYRGFMAAFELLNSKKYILTPDSTLNLEAVIKYFAKDDSFFNCKRLIKNLSGQELIPTFEKGLLLVGNYGNCKSSIMRTIEYVVMHNYSLALSENWESFPDWNLARFKFVTTHDLTSEYEGLMDQAAKANFMKKYGSFRYCLDDLKKESLALNFGKKNLVQSIFEKRYQNTIRRFGKVVIEKSFATMNYDDERPNDIEAALDEISTKYGPYIYDRFFQIFNIIEFKGKSYRF